VADGEVIRVVLRTFIDYPGDQEVASAALALLLGVSDVAGVMALISQHIPTILASLARHGASNDIMLAGLGILWNLLYGGQEATELVDHGVSKMLFESMRKHSASVEVQIYALGALRSISALDSCTERLVEAEGLGRVLESMGNWPRQLEVQAFGLGLLNNILSVAELRVGALRAAGLAAVVEATVGSMVNYQEAAEIQQSGLAVLRNTAEVPEGLEEVRAEKRLEPLLRRLEEAQDGHLLAAVREIQSLYQATPSSALP